jgi:alanine dehydrogenase
MIRENQIVYTYLHLAAAKELTEGLIKSKSINIAYETVTDDNGRLPLLAPMSAGCRENVGSRQELIVLRKIKREEGFY